MKEAENTMSFGVVYKSSRDLEVIMVAELSFIPPYVAGQTIFLEQDITSGANVFGNSPRRSFERESYIIDRVEHSTYLHEFYTGVPNVTAFQTRLICTVYVK